MKHLSGSWACRAAAVAAAVVIATAALGAIAAAPSASAADLKLPAAEQVIKKHIDATGGEAAYAKIKTRVTKGTFAIPAQGITLDMTIYAARPQSQYVVVESPMIGKFESGVSGDVVWENNMMAGASVKEGEERAIALRDAEFDGIIKWKDRYVKAECVGMDTVNGEPAYKVVFTPKEGEGKPRTSWFEVKSSLLVKTESIEITQMGSIPVTSVLSEYHDECGILSPAKVTIQAMGQDRIMTTLSVECNTEIPAERFALPEAIKALIEKKPEGEAEKK